jgi:hypothetical protein
MSGYFGQSDGAILQSAGQHGELFGAKVRPTASRLDRTLCHRLVQLKSEIVTAGWFAGPKQVEQKEKVNEKTHQKGDGRMEGGGTRRRTCQVEGGMEYFSDEAATLLECRRDERDGGRRPLACPRLLFPMYRKSAILLYFQCGDQLLTFELFAAHQY